MNWESHPQIVGSIGLTGRFVAHLRLCLWRRVNWFGLEVMHGVEHQTDRSAICFSIWLYTRSPGFVDIFAWALGQARPGQAWPSLVRPC